MAELSGAPHGLHDVRKPAQAQTVPIALSCSFFKGNERADLSMRHVKEAVSANFQRRCLGICGEMVLDEHRTLRLRIKMMLVVYEISAECTHNRTLKKNLPRILQEL